MQYTHDEEPNVSSNLLTGNNGTDSLKKTKLKSKTRPVRYLYNSRGHRETVIDHSDVQVHIVKQVQAESQNQGQNQGLARQGDSVGGELDTTSNININTNTVPHSRTATSTPVMSSKLSKRNLPSRAITPSSSSRLTQLPSRSGIDIIGMSTNADIGSSSHCNLAIMATTFGDASSNKFEDKTFLTLLAMHNALEIYKVAKRRGESQAKILARVSQLLYSTP